MPNKAVKLKTTVSKSSKHPKTKRTNGTKSAESQGSRFLTVLFNSGCLLLTKKAERNTTKSKRSVPAAESISKSKLKMAESSTTTTYREVLLPKGWRGAFSMESQYSETTSTFPSALLVTSVSLPCYSSKKFEEECVKKNLTQLSDLKEGDLIVGVNGIRGWRAVAAEIVGDGQSFTSTDTSSSSSKGADCHSQCHSESSETVLLTPPEISRAKESSASTIKSTTGPGTSSSKALNFTDSEVDNLLDQIQINIVQSQSSTSTALDAPLAPLNRMMMDLSLGDVIGKDKDKAKSKGEGKGKSAKGKSKSSKQKAKDKAGSKPESVSDSKAADSESPTSIVPTVASDSTTLSLLPPGVLNSCHNHPKLPHHKIGSIGKFDTHYICASCDFYRMVFNNKSTISNSSNSISAGRKVDFATALALWIRAVKGEETRVRLMVEESGDGAG